MGRKNRTAGVVDNAVVVLLVEGDGFDNYSEDIVHDQLHGFVLLDMSDYSHWGCIDHLVECPVVAVLLP